MELAACSFMSRMPSSLCLSHMSVTMAKPSLPRICVTLKIPDGVLSRLREHCEVAHHWELTDAKLPSCIRETLEEWISDVDGIFCTGSSATIDAALLAKATRLKVVSTMSVGVDHIDIAECTKRGIIVGNTPDVLTNTVADLVVALLLATARRLPEGVAHVKNGTWPDVYTAMWMTGKDVHHSTVGIIGMGRIGVQVAKRLSGFDCTILYPDRRVNESAQKFGQAVPMDELLAQSDFVVILCPLNASTRGMVNMDMFKKMKKSAVLINCSRGAVVNQEDLVQALLERVIGGAGLDVTTPEPLPPTHALLAPELVDRVVVLPHIGSASEATRLNMASIAVENLISGLAGNPMPSQVK